MIESVLVPKERINIFNKKVVKEIEKLGVRIRKSENVIEIEGEGFERIQAKNIVKAIARGFSPQNAFLLFDESVILEIIKIPGNEKNIKRIKSRIIGREGKAWKKIEELTGCRLSVYGKTVAIIGDYEKISAARRAVEMFINGASHKTVYRFLRGAYYERKSNNSRRIS